MNHLINHLLLHEHQWKFENNACSVQKGRPILMVERKVPAYPLLARESPYLLGSKVLFLKDKMG